MDIKGLRAGRASFTVSTSHGPRTYVVEVSDARVPISPQEIRTLLADLQDITVTPVGDKLIVSGRIMSSKERVRLDRVLKMYEGMVEDMTTGTEVMVDVAMTLIEVKTEKGSGVGFLDIIPTANVDYTNITDQGEGGRLIGEFSDGRLGFSVSADVTKALHAMVASGQGRILARSRVQCRNGTDAVINVGGEIPYNAIGEGGAPSVQYKTYGVTMRVTPELSLDAETIMMRMRMESSQPFDGSPTSGSALSSRSVELEAAVGKNEAMIIAGLYSKIRASSTRGGCLFPIFSSRTAEEDRELLVHVEPRLRAMDWKDFKKIKREDLER